MTPRKLLFAPEAAIFPSAPILVAASWVYGSYGNMKKPQQLMVASKDSNWSCHGNLWRSNSVLKALAHFVRQMSRGCGRSPAGGDRMGKAQPSWGTSPGECSRSLPAPSPSSCPASAPSSAAEAETRGRRVWGSGRNLCPCCY